MTCKSKTCVTKKQYNLVLKSLREATRKNNDHVYEIHKLKVEISKSNSLFHKFLTQIANTITNYADDL